VISRPWSRDSSALEFILSNIQNARKLTTLRAKNQFFFSDRGHSPSPAPPQWAGDIPPHTPTLSAPLASRSRDLKTQVLVLVSRPRKRFWQQHWIKVDVILFLSHFLVYQKWGIIGTKLPCDICRDIKAGLTTA